MAYIGRGTDSISNVEVLDNLTFDGSASYTLQKLSTNFVPSSANNLLISISGVVQQGNFSVSGSTITFDTTVSASDTCDWILHYGTGLITTVADGAITEAKLGSNAVTSAKINNGAITSAKLDSGLALGKIGQVVSSQQAINVNSTSSSYVDTGASATITPTSTSSKIYIVFNSVGGGLRTGSENDTQFGLTRDSGSSYLTEKRLENYDYGGSGTILRAPFSIQYLDSPSTTSAITYKIYGKYNNATSFLLGAGTGTDTDWTLMEVLA